MATVMAAKKTPINVAIFQNYGLPPHAGSGIRIGDLNVKVDILAGVLVTLHQRPEDGSVVVESGGTRTLPTGGLVALAGLAQNGNFRLVFLEIGFKGNGLHEIIPAPLNGHKTFRQGSRNSVLAKFDADAKYLDEDMDFTFEDFDMPEEFKLLLGML